MRSTNYQERALPLVSVDPKTGKYILSSEAEQFLRSVPAPIGVVSVAGLYRTGKSYLLNKMLLNRNDGFGVGPTINPCTKGLWCWGTPLRGESSDGERLNIIVIDTEGIGALDEDQTHDTRIFTLAILASSCFIYNSVGSIDETAVQNLSLVVNLTKNIQLRTDTLTENEDPDKIANYFPSFFWVVRDFSLQMVDAEGNKMTSKDYLQKALAPQKGFSEDTEQKNRIRKILTSFFKERECFTFVRPLTDETKLQDLAIINNDDLRGEFVSQILNLRKRVTFQMKPKTLNGQKLSGQLYLSMLSSYVGAINNGAVPNIENAWSYMCQEQCQKVLAESYDTFEKQIRQIRIPCSVDDFMKGTEMAEQAAYDVFKKKSIGEDTDKYYKELQMRMKERINELRKVNTEQGKAAFKKYIAPQVSLIQQKIGKQQYGSFEEFYAELSKLEQKTNKQCPKFVDLSLNCQLCINRILNQGISHMFKKMKLEKQHVKKTLEQRIKLMEGQVDNLKKQRDSEQSKMRQKISQLDREKVDMGFKLERTQMDLQRKTKDLGLESEQLSKNLNDKKKEVQSVRKQLEQKVSEVNKKMEEMNNNLLDERSHWDKEKALYELKIKQQTERIEELDKKKNTFESRLSLETNQLNQKHREQVLSLQEQIQELTKTLNSFKDKNEDLSTKFDELTEKHNTLIEKFQTTERKLKDDLTSKTRQMQRLKNDYDFELNKVKNQLSQQRDEEEKLGRDAEERLKKYQLRFKEMNEELKSTKARYDRENQILTQELEFTKTSYEETKQKINEMKAYHEGQIRAIQEDHKAQGQGYTNERIAKLQADFEKQRKQLEDQFNQSQKSLNTQVENLVKFKNELELKLKVNTQLLTNERSENEESKLNLTTLIEKLKNQIKNIEREKNSELFTKQGFYNQKLSDLETELEETKSKFDDEKNQLERNFNEKVTTIKNDYLMQSETQLKSHAEEKQTQKKKYNQMVEEYERRIEEETNALEQQLETLRGELEGQNIQLKTACRELVVEKDILSKQKKNLEDNLTQLLQKHQKMENELNERLQKLIESSRTERQILTRKVDELQTIKNDMEKQLLSITHERDNYKSQAIKNTSQIQELKTEKILLLERFETTKKLLEDSLRDVQSKYMNEKNKYDVQIAKFQQKEEFSTLKINGLENDLKTTKQRQQQQLRLLKERNLEQITNLTTKASAEKRAYEQKLQKLKKQSVETQSLLTRQLSQIRQNKAIDEQRIQHLEKSLKDIENRRNSEVESLNEQLKSTKEKLTNERAQLKNKVEELEELVHKKESQFTDLKNNYEIKFALADSKIKNLQQSSETALAEKTEMIRSLQRQLDEIRKKNEGDISTKESTYRDLFARMEGKYRTQISQLSQDVAKKSQQIEYLLKQHQRTIKDLNEKLAVERQSRVSLESKVLRVESEFSQKERNLTTEVQRFRGQKELQGLEMQKMLAKEKENFKSKLTDLQRKVTETDKQRQQTIYEKEKEQAKWNTEKNTYEQKMEELKQMLDKERNEGKRLMKDNQKLKAEKKRNSSYINIKNQTMMMPTEMTSENKENTQLQ